MGIQAVSQRFLHEITSNKNDSSTSDLCSILIHHSLGGMYANLGIRILPRAKSLRFFALFFFPNIGVSLLRTLLFGLQNFKAASNNNNNKNVIIVISIFSGKMIKTIERSNTTMTLQQLAALVGPEDVNAIHLANVELSGDESDVFDLAMALRGHYKLAEVSLTDITFQSKGLALDLVVEMILISCHNLCAMRLDNVPVSAKSCATLAYSDSLEVVSLIGNNFDDADAKLIADGVVSNGSPLVRVDLTGNKISDIGYKSLRHCVEKNMIIEEICLSGNRIGGIGGGGGGGSNQGSKTHPMRVATSAA